jgi:diguanylate cyclase (GGDEF)-like protein/PAS domain S-box-containing protein
VLPDLDLLTALFDLAPAGIAIADESGRCVLVNEAFCTMFGYRQDELKGHSFAMILPESDRHREADILQMALSQDPALPTQWRARHRDGHTLVVQTAIRTLQREDGSVRILTMLTDVTPLNVAMQELRCSEQALISLNESLEQQVAARTRDLEEANLALTRLVREDALTGMATRRAFEEDALAALAHAERYGRPLSMILLDLDHFKAINDQYGHPAGDEVLREMALRIRSMLRTSDKLARWGGEEFIILLPETSLMDAVQVGSKILMAVQSTPIPIEAGHIVCTFSAGLVGALPGEGLPGLICRADAQLYKAKQGGRNRLCWDEVAVPCECLPQAQAIKPATRSQADERMPAA